MGLGGVGIKLTDLVMLYTGLARHGRGGAADRARRRRSPQPPRRLLDPVAAWYVGNILIGAPPPENATPGRIAFKTGTSYGYRDAWAVGFDGRMTIGVWVGRPDGAPVPGLVRPRARRRRSCSTPSRAAATRRRRCAHAPKGAIFATDRQAAAAAAALRRRTARTSAAPSRRASCSRPTARASNWPAARARPGRAQDFRRRRAAHRHGQWRAAAAARPAAARYSSRPTGPALRGSRSWTPAAPPTASASACNSLSGPE